MPASVNPTCYHLSASSVASFKACPTRFRLAYREGLRLAADTDSQRQGTNWHQMHETYHKELTHARTVTAELRAEHPEHEHPGDDGTEAGHAYGLQAVVNLLNERYANVPQTKTAFEWALERQVLLTCFIGYQWYFTNDPIEVLASEVPFELPLHMPKTGLPLSTAEVVRVGKIDHVIRWQGGVCALERKSTSRSIDPTATTGTRPKRTRRSRCTPWRSATWCGSLRASTGSAASTSAPSGSATRCYDVWHKPTIKPKMLTQAETRRFFGIETRGNTAVRVSPWRCPRRDRRWE
jgi:hypothetical protein